MTSNKLKVHQFHPFYHIADLFNTRLTNYISKNLFMILFFFIMNINLLDIKIKILNTIQLVLSLRFILKYDKKYSK
jgi:hypothetical protein